METKLHIAIQPQPDDTTCGPTCLQAVYNYYEDMISLDQVILQVRKLKGGGTLATWMGCHALKRGFSVQLNTFNLQVFDPTWSKLSSAELKDRIASQMRAKHLEKVRIESRAYLEFLNLGGILMYEVFSSRFIQEKLRKSIPIIAGLSGTFLYGTAREFQCGNELIYDDIRGIPVGHFVVICGYDSAKRIVLLADPLQPNPMGTKSVYSVPFDRLFASIMLGILTFDANLLVITPGINKNPSS